MNQTIAYKIGSNLYLNITDRCTLACRFCPKNNGSTLVHSFDLALDHRPDTAEVIAAIDDVAAYSEIVFCGYGEPTLRLKVLLEVAQSIKAAGGRVRINTDGLASLVHQRDVLPDMRGIIDAISISMNAQNSSLYKQHCRPNLKGAFPAMLRFLQEASRYIPTVTATAIDGLIGVDIDACRHLAASCGAQFKPRKLDVVG